MTLARPANGVALRGAPPPAVRDAIIRRTPHPDNIELPRDVEPVDIVGGRARLAPALHKRGHPRPAGCAGWRDASPKGSSGEEDANIIVGDTGAGVDQTPMNRVFKRLVQAHDGKTLLATVASGVRATAVLSHQVKPVAPRRLFDEVERRP